MMVMSFSMMMKGMDAREREVFRFRN